MKKQYGENNLKKGGIAEEIAMLKQRREARKAKEDREQEAEAIRQRISKQEDEKYWETYGAKHSEYGGVYSDDAISDAFDGDPGACWNAD